MRGVITFLAASALAASHSFAALPAGAAAPDFKAPASLAGSEFTYSLKEALKKGPVVVYFFPSAYTGGCNLEAHTFATNKARFDSIGVSIIGVSLDNIARLNNFSEDSNYCAGKIAVASDSAGDIAKRFDLNIHPAAAGLKDTRGVVIGHGFAERTTFLVSTDGKIFASIGGLSPTENVDKTIAAARRLVASKNTGK
jgi:thioredoxin-dependent peroxiredoxin